jgi:ribosome-binding factor A
MLILKIQDPRLDGITVTGVDVDRELAYADVYVSAIEGASRAKEVIAGLQHAGGFLRKELAAVVDLRVFPRLRFHWDPTPENADRIEKLLLNLRQPKLPAADASEDAASEDAESEDADAEDAEVDEDAADDDVGEPEDGLDA